MASNLDSASVVKSISRSLLKLRTTNRRVITKLTEETKSRAPHAKVSVQIIHEYLLKKRRDLQLPVLYFIDSIISKKYERIMALNEVRSTKIFSTDVLEKLDSDIQLLKRNIDETLGVQLLQMKSKIQRREQETDLLRTKLTEMENKKK